MAKNRHKQKQTLLEPIGVPEAVEPSAVIRSNGDTLALPPAGIPSIVSENAVVSSSTPSLRSLTNEITLERAAYMVIALVALVLRVTNLDARPLAPVEAQSAAAAWSFLNGQPVGAYASPLLFTLDWLSFFLFGAFDLTARALPAALSTLLVFIPLLTRNALGRTGAFVAAVLIAISPTMVFFGRSLSGVDLAVGGALAALLLLNEFRLTGSTRALYFAAFIGASSLAADAAAFTVLVGGVIYLVLAIVIGRSKRTEETSEGPEQEVRPMERPLVRATILFVATYVLVATTFLLNRDGLGIAFNLLGDWAALLTSLGDFLSPLNLLLIYEPIPLIFGLAALVLVFAQRGESPQAMSILYLLASVTLFGFLFYTLVETTSPDAVVVIALPLAMLAGWFIGNLLERARDDIAANGGARSMLSGEIPVFVMLVVLAVLVYLQVATFTQNTNFSPALNQLYQALGGTPGDGSLTVAVVTLALISFLLLGVFIGLSVLLVGVARTTTLLAVTILLLLALGMLRATWLLNYSPQEPLRELLAPTQTPEQYRDLVRDLEFMSSAREGDPHILFLAVDPALGATARWYLRNFVNFAWANEPAAIDNAGAIVTTALGPPTGDWMGQRYQVNTTWEPGDPDGMAMWRWFMFREGGRVVPQTIMMWFPTQE